MDKATYEFKRDYIAKMFAEEVLFEQWLKVFFALNKELAEEYNIVYQGSFYVKMYELFTVGQVYATKILKAVENSSNTQKRDWYSALIHGLSILKEELTEAEFEYVEYRRHGTSHIFQKSYDLIQDDLRIKKVRKNKDLYTLERTLMD